MHVYIIGSRQTGPLKIGVANNPTARLRGLQTGSAEPLSLLHLERAGPVAAVVERTAHRMLSDRRETGEWFDISLIEAQAIVRGSMAATEILTNESASLSELARTAIVKWLTQCTWLDSEREEKDHYTDWDMHEIEPPDIFQTFAETCPHPPSKLFNFHDFLDISDTGVWLHHAAQLGYRIRDKRRLEAYIETEQRLKANFRRCDLALPGKWIEWSLARDLLTHEANALAHIWDEFAPLYNLIERDGPQRPTHKIDDHVNGVHLFVLRRDAEGRLPNCVVFNCESFLAILRPDDRCIGFGYDVERGFELRQLRNVPVSGFVVPHLAWDPPFLPWYRNAAQERDEALTNFIRLPNKQFPQPRPYVSGEAGAAVWTELLRTEELPRH